MILEHYIDGQEYSIDGIVVGDEPHILSVTKKYNLGSKSNYIMSGLQHYLEASKVMLVKR